ncbi:MAG TPA: four helix bundle protein [Terracidiphilus sp.]|jgi:four helix bundle protein|nr:four helix bundle protein [Terracidiphilus sp.]
MARPKSYRELIVWQKAMALARQVYAMSGGMPKTEAYGLMAQIRRAAVSVPSNIAEGHGRLTDLQFRHFLGNARGSLYELQTQIELAADLSYLNKEQMQKLMEQGSEVARLINGLLTSLGRSGSAREVNANTANTANSANSANSANKGNQQ